MSYGRHLLPYQVEKRELERARREARRTHAQPCGCPFCITPAAVDAILAARTAAERARIGEAPF